MKNRFDLIELGGAFGDIGTLIPFVVAYISILKVAPSGIFLAMGGALIVAGFHFKTPFPVQPMKAIGAAAITQTVGATTLTPAIVTGAGLATGVIWLVLAATGLAKRFSKWIPKPVLAGIVLGLGFSFMLEGLRRMFQSWLLAGALLAMTLILMARSRLPAMFVLMIAGAFIAIVQQPALVEELALIKPVFQIPTFAWPNLSWQDIWMGALLLALPQLPLTFGNAFIAITEENNRLFPERKVTEREVAFSTGIMNVCSSALGGIPICHGAGGMAGHIKFGARTGGASVMLGILLIVLALFFADSIATLFLLFPPAVLGVVLFLAGTELALGGRDIGTEKSERFIALATAAFTVLNVGVAVVFGFLAFHAFRRGWIKF